MSTLKQQQKKAVEAEVGPMTGPAPKINPFSLKRPASVIKTFTFEDPNSPDPVVLTLKKLDPAEMICASELAEVYCDRFLATPAEDGSPTMPKHIFPLIDGQPVMLSKLLLQSAAMLWMMAQNTHEDSSEKQYSVEDFVCMSVVIPDAWMQIGAAMAEIQGSGPKNLKEPTG